MKCMHEAFESEVIVARITGDQGAASIGYMAHVRIRCTACGTDFLFAGAPAGWSRFRPATSADAREIRLPITPQTSKAAQA
jgi:hypothetical protein